VQSKKYPEGESCQMKVLLASKTVLDVVFVGWGIYPKSTVITCLVPS
jgi:hypothetical protein